MFCIYTDKVVPIEDLVGRIQKVTEHYRYVIILLT